ncbi:hypothetical protein [Butyrivibrio sp. AE2015]|uniref:hypothetical protein n=1 Tax=Butyrivibrio sp. AE2015 TaxID=1280663 RepID=UPI0003B54B74|nr:hypothetical protein [Butyrivibrio sp. AE2015]
MQKKFLVSLTATATAFSMLVAPSLTAFAEDAAAEETSTSVSNPEAGSQSSSEGSSTSSATPEDQTSPVNFNDGQKHTVGNVTTKDGGTAVTAYNEGTIINVEGTVDASGVKVNKNDDTVTYKGATGVSVSNGANVIIEKNVTGGSRGISANNDSSLTVKGDVTATGTDQTSYKWNNETQKYDIQENSVSGIGVETNGDATINIGGDISAFDDGILINPDNYDNKGSIIVEGTITAASDTGKGIQIYKVPKKYDGITFDDVKDALDDVPELTIYEIDAKYPVYVRMATADDPDNPNQKIETAVINAINYIVKQNKESVDKYGMAVSGTTAIDKYDTVKIGQEFTVKVDEIPEGYELNAGDNVKVTKNEDGSFTLKLENEKGGIYVQVRLIPVSNPDGSTSYVVEPTPEQFDNNNQDRTETPQSTAGAIVISNNQGAADTPSTVAAISGTKPARTASYNLGTVTPIQYKESIIANVAAAPEGGAFNIQTDRVSCFDKKMIQAFASRPDIDVNVVFTYGGKKLKVTIPAGYDVNKLLDDNGYCGFLRLMSILGATEL